MRSLDVVKQSIRGYAKTLNIDEKSVRKAIAEGKIKRGYDKLAKKILPELANKEWGFQHQVVKQRAGVSRSKAIEKISANKPDPDDQEIIIDGNPEDLIANIKITSQMSAQDAMKYREVIGAALDKKKLEEAEGKLVQREKVEKVFFAIGTELKKSLFNMPQRIVRDIMAAPNEVEAINIFNEELTQILSSFGSLKQNAFQQ